MKIITIFMLIATVLFPGCSTPDSKKSRTASPTQFWFDYQYPPSPGKRTWKKVDQKTWTEEYGSGVISRFKAVGRETVEGISGTVVAKIGGDRQHSLTGNDGGFQVFIPDKRSGSTKLWCRNKLGSKWEAWKWLNNMQGVE